MSNTRLIIKQAKLTDEGILIRTIEIIDSISGEIVKITKLTPELLEFIKMIEIDIDYYFDIQEMKKKNPNFRKLIQSFKLFT